jgi:aryl-alcohol dehydrogenase-like predicted oxidoreductase
VNICLDSGVTLFDTANVYSNGTSEEILGKALEGLRNRVLVSTKATFPMSQEPNEYGSSRYTLIRNAEDSLRRLKMDHIDLYHMHGFDANTPLDETLRALDDLVTSGKIRYIACSNFSGWHLMKSLSVSERYGWAKYVAHQAYYSLLDREFEWELMPLGLDQNVGTIVWSPLSSGRLTGKFRRDAPMPLENRMAQGGSHGPATNFERLYKIVDAIGEIAKETDKTVSQIAINWLTQRPTVANVVIGARNEEQLKQNLGAVGWNLSIEQIKKLDAASDVDPVYPYWHQRQNPDLIRVPNFYASDR